MAEAPVSPISQLLQTLGITREELVKHSAQMRQFLTTDDAMSSRVSDLDMSSRPRSGSDLQPTSRSVGATRTMARSLSRTRTTPLREPTPPQTPVKTEPLDSTLPHRRMDSMEMVIERQRRHRRSRRDRERDTRQHPPSPSPSNASYSGQSQVSVPSSRDEPKPIAPLLNEASTIQPSEPTPTVAQPPPVTPQKNKYYRDHTNLSVPSNAQKDTPCKSETPTPTRPANPVAPQAPLPQFYAYHPAFMTYPHYLPLAYRSLQAAPTNALPATPQTQRTLSLPLAPAAGPSSSKAAASPLPPSSPPPPASSPMSSPSRRVVNLVSSPGPMGPELEETEYDNLPYKLPPGPYLSTKPDLSYAALIGRAILSSTEHRLTLQEIYDWITIVYPYYKRGETTWMNSIRHVLSTTVVFRKVPRDRSVGRTLWAIYDADLECFKDGGFKRHLTKDPSSAADAREKGSATAAKGKGGRTRKRAADDDDAERKPKRARKDPNSGDPSVVHSSFQVASLMHPLFPPRATPHLQPYYQSLMPQPQLQTFPTVPADVIFPPLPPTAYTRIASAAASTSSAASVSTSRTGDTSTTASSAASPPPSSTSGSSPPPSTIPSSASSSALSSSSVPELTPHRNSSSPPSSLLATSDLDIDMDVRIQDPRTGSHAPGDGIICTISTVVVDDIQDEPQIHEDELANNVDDDADKIFNTNLLGPVKYWKEPTKVLGGLQPGIELMDFEDDNDTNSRPFSVRDKKGKRKAPERPTKNSMFPPMPTSPTLHVRANQNRPPVQRPTTPISSSASCPATPPRNNETTTTHKTSSIRTPISYKGIHMSPSTSLAHYKSNLDPPPVYNGGGAGVTPLDTSSTSTNPHQEEEQDPTRTPRKRTSLSGAISVFGHPVTPKKLVFSTSASANASAALNLASTASESPFRTPLGSLRGLGSSPLRTPRSRARAAMYDPHDPRTLLDDELQRMSSYEGESPMGLFGKEKSSLLYDSPGLEGYKWW